MDLSTLAVSQKEFKMLVRHPVTGEVVQDSDGKDMYIGILSSDTHTAKKALTDFKRVVREAGKDATEDKLNDLKCEFLSQLTTSCNLEFNEKKVKFTQKAICDIISNEGFSWLADYIMRNVDARANFMQS